MNAIPAHVPAVGRPRPFKIPPFTDNTLRNGLRVLAIRRPTVPRVEAVLRIPAGVAHDKGDGGRARLMRETILAGTANRTALDIARDLQSMGGSLDASTDADDLIVSGGVLSSNLVPFLELIGEIATAAAYPAEEITVARERLAQEIIIARSQPGSVAAEALRARLFGKHRYGRPMPEPEAVKRLGAVPVRKFHAEHVLPRGSTLVLVGDLQPKTASEAAATVFSAWKRRPGPIAPPPPPPIPVGRPALIVHRAGAVQTNIRIGGPAVARSHPDFYKLSLALMVFGGYFSSRLVKNIREDKGYTYSPGARFDHRRGMSSLFIVADVGTDVTAASLVEIDYELSRVAAMPVAQEELDSARRYLAGVTSLSVATQAGLAAQVDGLLASGMSLDYLRELRGNLEMVSLDDVQDAGARYLAPRWLSTVLVGDATKIAKPLEALTPTEVNA